MAFSRQRPAPIDSPCIGVCTLDHRGYCQGCGRTVDQISRWLQLSVRERDEVMAEIDRRRRRPGKSSGP